MPAERRAAYFCLSRGQDSTNALCWIIIFLKHWGLEPDLKSASVCLLQELNTCHSSVHL